MEKKEACIDTDTYVHTATGISPSLACSGRSSRRRILMRGAADADAAALVLVRGRLGPG